VTSACREPPALGHRLGVGLGVVPRHPGSRDGARRLRIDVGLPEHRVRYVLPDPSSAGPRAAGLTEPGTWLKVCGSPEQMRLSSKWTIDAPEYLMSTELGALRPVTPPDRYTVELHSTGDVHDVVVRTVGGEYAAKGRIAVRGHAAVIDMVETDPAHLAA
jgi:hypothetical protein